MLTSLTTFFGLIPMLLERTAQAQSMVPMAISLAFGIVFATVITLLLVPSLYMILDDLDRWWTAGEEEGDAIPGV
jgi:multidrug efflux pump subunit AcrB